MPPPPVLDALGNAVPLDADGKPIVDPNVDPNADPQDD
jgi:hypothetical protein